MTKPGRFLLLTLTLMLAVAGCGGGRPDGNAAGGGSGAAGAGSGSAGASAMAGGGGAGTSGSAGVGGGAGAIAAAGATGTAGAGQTAGTSGGDGGGASGADAAAGAGGSGTDGGAGGHAGVGATGGTSGGVNMLPAGYAGTPFAALKIPGRINAADYDRGGAGVAWCHNVGACSAGTVTGDYPSGSPPYRPPVPATAKLCSGAACDDNVGVCRMNPQKPDNLVTGQPAPATDTYLCYSVAGEWTKYTVVVAEAGTYAVGGFMAVPQGGGVNLSFGGNITTGNLALAITSTAHSGSGENYHSWEQRENLATVTFPAAGTYLMTLTQVGRFNADNFTFTKM